MTIDIEQELVNNHSDVDIIAFLDRTTTGLLQNYNNALKLRSPELLWGSYGDIIFVASVIRKMKQRNDAHEALKES